METLVLLPILVPFIAAILSLLAWKQRRVQEIVSLIGTTVLLAVAVVLLMAVWNNNGPVAMQVGDWEAPFGITLVADLFSAIMVNLAALMGLAVAIYSLSDVDHRRKAFGYYPLYHILLMGICGSFLTGDIFNLYVWFEVMLLSSFVLLALGGAFAQMKGAIKYVTINLLASAIFLAAVGILYGLAGTLNMADLALELKQVPNQQLVTTVAMLFLVAFGIKAAVFPLFFWLPAAYHTPPVAVSAIFAGLLTKVGVYALIRVFTLLFIGEVGFTHTLLLLIASLTMITGVLGAASERQFRRILSFHIISQIGYMIMGLGLFTPLALAGSIFYIIHHIVVKTNLFLVSGVVNQLQDSFELDKLGGLYRTRPLLGVLFLIPALSLAGVPPLSGFWAKLTLVRAGLGLEQYLVVAASLVVSLLTLFSMTKVWGEVFWKERPSSTPERRVPSRDWHMQVGPIVVLAICTLVIGLSAEPVFTVSMAAAEQLMNPNIYIEAVLGSG